MNWLALRMLTGDWTKFIILVLAVAFAELLMAHQSSVFWGVMLRTTNLIHDVNADLLWVMDVHTRYIDEVKPLPFTDVYRVRGVRGVAWAVPFFKGLARVQVEDEPFRTAQLLGLDDDTLVGGSHEMILGHLADLAATDAVAVDEAGFHYLWPDEPLALGKTMQINGRRAVLVGVCKAMPPFQTMPIVLTRRSLADRFCAPEGERISFVLAQVESDADPNEVCRRIRGETGLLALNGREFAARTIHYYFVNTGIPLNFMVVVAIGFVVGLAVAAQTFYLFTVEHLKQFGTLKAMGVGSRELVRMVLCQALVVGLIGYGIGAGLTTLLIGQLTAYFHHLAGFYLPWQVLLGTGGAVLVIMALSSLACLRRVIVLEPAAVFRG